LKLVTVGSGIVPADVSHVVYCNSM